MSARFRAEDRSAPHTNAESSPFFVTAYFRIPGLDDKWDRAFGEDNFAGIGLQDLNEIFKHGYVPPIFLRRCRTTFYSTLYIVFSAVSTAFPEKLFNFREPRPLPGNDPQRLAGQRVWQLQ